ncbi:MAG: DUF4249 family protein [Saprospiraceae bacterium]|nr:DUF4249 family protein [Saprospiraceae bacterium]
MKKIIQYITFCLITFLMSSCDDDKFSPLVEIETPPHKPRLVVRADWSIGSDSLAVFVSRSRGVLDKDKANFGETFTYFNGTDTVRSYTEYYDTVPNTKVELLRNGQLLGTIPYREKGYHVAKGLYKLDTIPNTVYTIRVSAPNFETVEASQKVQNRFSVLRGSFQSDAAIYDNRNPFDPPQKGDALSIELKDDANDENYYTIDRTNSGFRGGDFSPIITRDTLGKSYTAIGNARFIDPNMDKGFLSDIVFSGKTYLWRFWLRPELYFSANSNSFQSRLKSGDKVTLNIRSTSKDFVLFIKTLDLAQQASDNPFFTEPVILHSNVKNGYGVFTLGSVQTIQVVVQ